MSKGKYYYDKKSLSYKKIKMTKVYVLKLFLSYFFPIIFLSFITCFSVVYFLETPGEKAANKENQFLLKLNISAKVSWSSLPRIEHKEKNTRFSAVFLLLLRFLCFQMGSRSYNYSHRKLRAYTFRSENLVNGR